LNNGQCGQLYLRTESYNEFKKYFLNSEHPN